MPTLRNRECEKHHLKRTLNGWCTTSNKRISFDTAFFVLIQIVLTFSFVLRLMRFSKQQRQFNKTASAPERQTHIYIQQLRTFHIYIHSERCKLNATTKIFSHREKFAECVCDGKVHFVQQLYPFHVHDYYSAITFAIAIVHTNTFTVLENERRFHL